MFILGLLTEERTLLLELSSQAQVNPYYLKQEKLVFYFKDSAMFNV